MYRRNVSSNRLNIISLREIRRHKPRAETLRIIARDFGERGSRQKRDEAAICARSFDELRGCPKSEEAAIHDRRRPFVGRRPPDTTVGAGKHRARRKPAKRAKRSGGQGVGRGMTEAAKN